MKLTLKKILAWIVSLVLLALLLALVMLKLIDIYERPKRVASILNITALPNSVRVLDCDSEIIPTDIVATCSIEIDPKDFPILLRGYNFTESPTTRETSHSVVFTKTGPEFPIATEFVAEPKEFKYGGHVIIFADQERKRAVIDLYIE